MSETTGVTALRTGTITGTDATKKLARHAAILSFEKLPDDLLEIIKCCVLDTLGVAIGASALAPEGKILADYVGDLGGKAESTILGFGTKAPAPWAALVGSFPAVGHCLNFGKGNEMRTPTRWTIFNGRWAAGRLAAVSRRAILPGAWAEVAVIMATGCTDAIGPGRPADAPWAWVSVNHSGITEGHVGPLPAVADVVGSGRIDTRNHIDL